MRERHDLIKANARAQRRFFRICAKFASKYGANRTLGKAS